MVYFCFFFVYYTVLRKKKHYIDNIGMLCIRSRIIILSFRIVYLLTLKCRTSNADQHSEQ